MRVNRKRPHRRQGGGHIGQRRDGSRKSCEMLSAQREARSAKKHFEKLKATRNAWPIGLNKFQGNIDDRYIRQLGGIGQSKLLVTAHRASTRLSRTSVYHGCKLEKRLFTEVAFIRFSRSCGFGNVLASGFWALSKATIPATIGAAIEVPVQTPYRPPGSVLTISSPGAVTSTHDGSYDEKRASES